MVARLKQRRECMRETEFGDSEHTKDAPERKRSVMRAGGGKELVSQLAKLRDVECAVGASSSSAADGGAASSGGGCVVMPTSTSAAVSPLMQQIGEAGELEMAETQTVSTVHRSLWHSTTQTITTSRYWRARRPASPDMGASP